MEFRCIHGSCLWHAMMNPSPAGASSIYRTSSNLTMQQEMKYFHCLPQFWVYGPSFIVVNVAATSDLSSPTVNTSTSPIHLNACFGHSLLCPAVFLMTKVSIGLLDRTSSPSICMILSQQHVCLMLIHCFCTCQQETHKCDATCGGWPCLPLCMAL